MNFLLMPLWIGARLNDRVERANALAVLSYINHDISYIQNLLGHGSIKATMIYANVARKNVKNVKSPLDNL